MTEISLSCPMPDGRYAYDLVKAMGIRDVEDGVVRISMLHYNSPEEVDRLLSALTEILAM